MSKPVRLVLLIVSLTFVWGCGSSSQAPKKHSSQVVRRKIAAKSSAVVKTKQIASAANSAGITEKSQSPAASVDPATALLKLKNGTEAYHYKGIVDPFLPLIKEDRKDSSQKSEGQPQKKKRTPRTPLEKIDLTQLSLTAIFKEQNRIKGLVEDPAGKGYIVTSGTYIGLDGGRITKVLDDRIIITENSLDVMGKPVTDKRELKLRQSSGE